MGDVLQRVCGEERTIYKSSALSNHCVDHRDESWVTRLGTHGVTLLALGVFKQYFFFFKLAIWLFRSS